MVGRRTPKDPPKGPQQPGLNRRSFFTKGVAAGALGAAAVASVGRAEAAEEDSHVKWDYEADVVVIGSGGVGLTAALRAVELGASVLVLEQSFDVGGKLSHNNGWTSLGGGDAIQERDRLGLDPDNMGLTKPLAPPEDLTDDPDLLFKDVTDWSVVNNAAIPEYRYNDRELHRAWADNTAAVRQFMMDHNVHFSRVAGTHYGGGMSKARAPWAIMKVGDKTDIEAGTISKEDAGSLEEGRSSQFAPEGLGPPPSATGVGAPGWVYGGFAISRPFEYNARNKGVRFMVNRHMDEVIREPGGRVIGVTASYTPRFSPKTGSRLESLWNNGNIDDKTEVVRVRARKAVIIGTGGYMGNRHFRTMFDPRMSEPSIQYGTALMGPAHEDAVGIIASMKVGASLAGLLQPYGYDLGLPRLVGIIGTPSVYDAVMPGGPAAEFVRSFGVSIGGGGWEYIIAVNQVGKRFYSETSIGNDIDGHATYPPGNAGTNNPFTPLDWRNSSVAHIKATYSLGSGSDAALAMNEGSQGPDYSSGPVWAVFDQDAVDTNGWELSPPYIADPPDGNFFKADTIAELAHLVLGNEFQKMPLKYLEDTVKQYNAFADTGKDTDFEKPTMHKIAKAPFYAVLIPMAVNDSYGGLRINGKCQVIDMAGAVIPGLYSGGEASGGGRQHGIGRATVTGYIAGTNAVEEPLV